MQKFKNVLHFLLNRFFAWLWFAEKSTVQFKNLRPCALMFNFVGILFFCKCFSIETGPIWNFVAYAQVVSHKITRQINKNVFLFESSPALIWSWGSSGISPSAGQGGRSGGRSEGGLRKNMKSTFIWQILGGKNGNKEEMYILDGLVPGGGLVGL